MSAAEYWVVGPPRSAELNGPVRPSIAGRVGGGSAPGGWSDVCVRVP